MTAPSFVIKICGITRRADAEAAVDAGASTLGFVFVPTSPRCVTPEQARLLGEGLPIWKAGIFVNETAASIEAAMRAARLDIAQIYGGEAPSGVRIWRAFRMGSAQRPPAAEDVEAVLLDGPANGTGFNWSLAHWSLARDPAQRVIVAGGLDASNVAEAIRKADPWGVDACSRLESAPGIKDHEKIRQFIETARKAQEATA
ncbi:MAG TPA: phosphoribosylanthranilate isomerase [Bryobacteraceae bacterium]|nr:phosphoribosylanthranilate isomerase [Bryobacteraceae bacterium]